MSLTLYCPDCKCETRHQVHYGGSKAPHDYICLACNRMSPVESFRDKVARRRHSARFPVAGEEAGRKDVAAWAKLS